MKHTRRRVWFPAVPPSCEGVRLRLEGSGVYPNATRGLSLFSVNLATRGLAHIHYRFLKGGIETLIELKAHTHNLIGGSQAQQMSQETQEQQV